MDLIVWYFSWRLKSRTKDDTQMKFLSLALLVFSAPLVAKGKTSFLESLLPSKKTSPETVYARIKSWGEVPGNYLSLGESHLEPTTVNFLNHKMANIFISAVKNEFTFCSEDIDQFLMSSEGVDIQARAKNTLVVPDNSPSVTNFTPCSWPSESNALIYSGFFHQHPFARPWPLDFPSTPVILNESNNIWEQLPSGKGMFISQIEMTFIESRASQNLMENLPFSINQLKQRVNRMIEMVAEIISSQEILIEGDPYTNKYGAFYSRKSIGADLLMPKEAWLLITNRGYRLDRNPFPFLRKILELPATRGKTLMNKIKGELKMFKSLNFVPLDNGTKMRAHFHNLIFDGESEMVVLNDRTLILLETGSSDFKCFEFQEEYKEIECTKVF
jgi:hypothetical protein